MGNTEAKSNKMSNAIEQIKNKMQANSSSVIPFSRPNMGQIKKNLAGFIAPVQLQRLRQDVLSWRDVMTESENVYYPHRVKAQRLFIDTMDNGHVFACWERRKDMTLLRKWEFVNSKNEADQTTEDIFLETVKGQSQNKSWFIKFLNYSMDAIAYGYSLIALGSIKNDEFPNIDIIKRWNVSPDRLNVTNFTYSISGANFMEEPYKDWHVYIPTYNDIGTSPAGYGLLYKVAIYEIFLRNILGFNGDFVELYSQPYRVGKTTKTNDTERSEFANAIQRMGSAGWAMIDPEDAIEFLETKLGGTGFQGYDNFEQRLEKKISKIILGHADAIDSIPGKLGNGKVKSPADVAMEDKQMKDGSFISSVINNSLLPKMRKLGFSIPDDVKAVLKNDSEISEINNTIIDQAVRMASAGLPMDADYFTEQTGILISAPPSPSFSPSIKNRLNKIYNHVQKNKEPV